MCELLAMSANVPTDIRFSFSGLVERSGDRAPHRDGFGIAFYEGAGLREFKDYTAACKSPIANLLKELPIRSTNVLAHIRQANVGEVNLANTHPFRRELWGREWIFAHNGQLDLSKIQKPVNSRFQAVGTTDSEQVFCQLMSELSKQWVQQPAEELLTPFIKNYADRMAELGVFNFVLCNGDYMYAYCTSKLSWITRKAPFGQAQLSDTQLSVDFAQETTLNDVVTVVATEPLTNNEEWQRMGKGEMLVLYQGMSVEGV